MGFYIGTYASAEEDGILEVKYDRETDSLQVTGRQRGVTNPSWLLLHPNGRVLYAVEERNPDGGLCAFLIDEALGGKETFPVAGNDAATQEQQERQGTPFLHPCGSWPTGGADPCHLSLDDRGEFLFVSNYTSGSLAVFRLGENGVPAERTDLVQHTGHSTGPGADPVRQEGPHVHFSAFHEGELYVVDLGQDTVFRYELDRESGRLRDTGRPIVLPAGRGPRHLAFGPDNRLYVLCELSSSLFVLEKQEDGAYQAVQEISALSQGVTDKVNTAAAIHFSEDGRMLYTSNRGEDSIAAFALEEDGRVRRIGFAASGGRVPRDFAVCGDRLLAANQESNELTVLVNLENDIKNMNHQDPAGEKQRSTVNHEKWSGIDQEEKGEGVLFALPTQGRPVCLTPVPEPHELPEPHPEEESNKAPEPCTGEELRSDELSLDELSLEELLDAIHMPEEVAACVRQAGDDGKAAPLSPGLRMLAVMLHGARTRTWREYRARGIGREVFFATMGCFSRFVGEHYASTGRYDFDRGFWTPRQLSLRIFRLGTLEYELTDSGALSVHIPSDADLSREALRDSYEDMKEFMSRFFPDYAQAQLECESWLLSPALRSLLPETSKILIFQSAFVITEQDPEAADYLEWVYGMTPAQQESMQKNLGEEELAALPDKTSLQRAMKEYLLNGGKVGTATGVLQESW